MGPCPQSRTVLHENGTVFDRCRIKIRLFDVDLSAVNGYLPTPEGRGPEFTDLYIFVGRVEQILSRADKYPMYLTGSKLSFAGVRDGPEAPCTPRTGSESP